MCNKFLFQNSFFFKILNQKTKYSGCFLLLGKGNIPKDPFTAREWLKLAAAEGDLDAKRLLAQRF